jgi:8-oxo-dGTP diphosphatase
MAIRDGNGWTRCGQGHRHWGKHGAAGLLAYTSEPPGPDDSSGPHGSPGPDGSGRPGRPGGRAGADGEVSVLLQLRSGWGHHGGTWGLPGGAMDSHESPEAAALREAAEECGVPADEITIRGIWRDDHTSWTYWTVIGSAPAAFPAYPASAETSEVAWVREADVGRLALHPGFAAQWPVLRAALRPVTVIVDVANVMGSRPDGWWRDRAGAAARLRDQLTALADRGLESLPDSMGAPALELWFPCFVLVVEGQARVIARDAQPGPGRRVRVTAAAGSGDDALAAIAAELSGWRLVVTADRELRRRCEAAGASVVGPGWLLGLV